MNYELAKQLKEAGFPHKCSECCDHCHFGCKECNDKTGYFCCPPLSELIEACVCIDGTFHLNLGANYAPKGIPWVAGTRRQLVANCHPLPDDKNLEYGFGKTPEEAVANLYLALNKKRKVKPTDTSPQFTLPIKK